MSRPAAILSRTAATAGLLVLAAVLGFYVNRLFMPLPIYAGDEGSYLIRALYPPEAIARDPLVADINNGAFLGLIQIVRVLSVDSLIWLRIVGLASYLGGVLVVWQAATRTLPRGERTAFLILALAFPYYRFVVTALPEGAYVLVLALVAAATARLYRTRPVAHALAAGALTAVLVLLKPHGLAVAAGLAALAVVDAAAGGGWRRLALRAAVFAAAFLAVGNAVQWATGQAVAGPLTFFIGPYYGRTLAAAPGAGAPAAALLALATMGSAVLALAGPPIVLAGGHLLGRWRREGRALRLEARDLLFLLLLLSLAATLAMVAIFAMKMAVTPAESKRLWGRYFEFFIPLLWLAAAPYVAGAGLRRGLRLACAGAVLAGLAGLLAGFAAGIVLFPWDASALTAFFAPDAARATIGTRVPYRALAVAATLAAAGLLMRGRPARVWTGYFLALGLLSTALDSTWVGAIVQQRRAFHQEATAAAALTRPAGRTAVMVADNNDAHLSFLAFDGAAQILVAPPGAPEPAQARLYDRLVVVAPAAVPAGDWRKVFGGERLSVYERAP